MCLRNGTYKLLSALRQERGLAPAGYEVHLVSVDERQPRHQQVHRAARLIAATLQAGYEVLDPTALSSLPASITAKVARLSALGGVVAVRVGAEVLAAGVHAGGSSRTEEWTAYLAYFNRIVRPASTAATSLPYLRLITPFIQDDFADLICLGQQLGVPLAATWSCDQGYAFQCGSCAACIQRKAAFSAAGVNDQTRYRHAVNGR